MFYWGAPFVLVFCWLVPNHYPPWSSVYNEACAAVSLVLFAVSNWRHPLVKPAPNSAWIVAGAALIPVVQWAFAQLLFSGDVVVSALYLIGFAASITVGHAIACVDFKRLGATLGAAALIGSLISVILGLNQALGVGGMGIWMSEMLPGGRAFANLAQPNNFATLLGFGALGLLLLREQARVSKGLAVFLLAVLVVGLALSQSRTALLFGPFVAALLWFVRRRVGSIETRLSVVLFATAGQWVIAWGWPGLQSLWLLVPPESLAERGVEPGGRLQLWAMLLESVQRVPWKGYGWLQVGEAELAVVNQHPPIGEMWLHGHNLFVELLVWCGIPLGLLLFSLIIYWLVSRAWRIRSVEAIAGYLTVCLLMIHAMFELPHHYAYFLIPAGMWIGLIECSINSPGLASPKWNLLPQAVALLLLVCIMKDYPVVEEDARLVRFETQRIGNLRAAQPAPNAPFLSTLTEFLRFMRTPPRPGMSDAELVRAEAIVKRYPYPLSLSRYADMLALNGRLPEAIEAFKSIRQMYTEHVYINLRRELHARFAEGQAGLKQLDDAVPHY